MIHYAISDRRFILQRIQIVDGHWLWQRSYDNYGYAQCSGRRTKKAHRLSYMAFVGPIPKGMDLGHVNCPYRYCVNPDCLKPMTHRENIDMIRRRVK